MESHCSSHSSKQDLWKVLPQPDVHQTSSAPGSLERGSSALQMGHGSDMFRRGTCVIVQAIGRFVGAVESNEVCVKRVCCGGVDGAEELDVEDDKGDDEEVADRAGEGDRDDMMEVLLLRTEDCAEMVELGSR